VLRIRSASAISAALIGVATLAAATAAPPSPGAVVTIPVPHGLAAAWAAGEGTATGRAHALLDLIRQTYDSPSPRGTGRTAPAVQALAAHLEHVAAGTRGYRRSRPASLDPAIGPANGNGARAVDIDAAPLPLPVDVWVHTVFGGRTTPRTLLTDILSSREAALFYNALFWLDDETRAWLAHEPALVASIVQQYAARFTVAAPAFRVANRSVRLPGGEAALAGWEALVGASADAPSEFLRALLDRSEGRLAYFFGAMGQVPGERLRLGLDLDASRDRRVDAMRRLYGAFERLSQRWVVDAAPFWRPTLDPALLLADLASDEAGALRLPGTLEFWQHVLADDRPSRTAEPDAGVRTLAVGEPIDFPALCDLLSRRDPASYQRAHYQVLFASRNVPRVTTESVRDAVDAIRAAGSQPALVGTLERAGVRRVPVFARASRRAAAISRIRNAERAGRTLRQFQGALFVLARATLRGALPHPAFEAAVESLVAVPLGGRGEYEGRLVSWLAGVLGPARPRAAAHAPGASAPACGDPFDGVAQEADSLDVRLLRLLAGDAHACPTVEWEGMRYRVDFAWAEGTRLLRLLGDGQRPYLATASEAVTIAEELSAPAITSAVFVRQQSALDALANAVPWEPETRAAFDDAVLHVRSRKPARAAAALRSIADDLLARGLTQVVYAASLGHPDRVMVPAGEAAARHDYRSGQPGAGAAVPGREWRLPVPVADGTRDWRMSGSLLGMDVSLAELRLVGVSTKPPLRPPTLNEADRRAFVETVALTEAAALTDADATAIVTALRRGRARVAAVRTAGEAAALADEAGASAARRTLISWTVDHEPRHVAAAFAPIELFRLGAEAGVATGRLDPWGAPSAARTGCLCLSLDAPRPWEVLAGRLGMVSSAFPDLKLRLVELLAELALPASLLAPVLAPATLDFVNTVTPRSRHDRRALEDHVRELRVEHLEQYLALLTTDGPLVPVDGGVARGDADASAAVPVVDRAPAATGAGAFGARP
jgi:hypothetical protein